MRDGKLDTEALVKSYVELEKTRGTPAAASSEAPKPAPETDAGTPATPQVSTSFEPFEKEFVETGKLSDASYKTLADRTGFSRDDIDGYIAYRQSRVSAATTEVLSSVGGSEGFSKLSDWASKNLKPDEITSVNAILANASKDPGAAKLALAGLKARHESAVGTADPALVGGSTSSAGGIVPFTSTAEATKAIRDPRYARDESYRKTVEARMNASAIFG
jgi:hypothetical protein